MRRRPIMPRTRRALLASAVLYATLSPGLQSASAQSVSELGAFSNLVVEADRISLRVSFSTGVALDLEVGFESVIGLSAESLGLSARLIDPLDPGLIARLPANVPVSIPAQFPVLLTVEPPATGPLSFTGVYTLEIHTHQLHYQGLSPLRLFRAPLEGSFQDITSLTAAGSYRARGTDGGFSQFLIAADTTPVDQVIANKLDRLRGHLYAHSGEMSTALFDDLRAVLDDVEWAYSNDDLVAAIEGIDEFGSLVAANSGGSGLPDVWRSSRDLVNVAGSLRGSAQTVRFSLSQKANGAI